MVGVREELSAPVRSACVQSRAPRLPVTCPCWQWQARSRVSINERSTYCSAPQLKRIRWMAPTQDPIAPASVSRDYRTIDREITSLLLSRHPGRREAVMGDFLADAEALLAARLERV